MQTEPMNREGRSSIGNNRNFTLRKNKGEAPQTLMHEASWPHDPAGTALLLFFSLFSVPLLYHTYYRTTRTVVTALQSCSCVSRSSP